MDGLYEDCLYEDLIQIIMNMTKPDIFLKLNKQFNKIAKNIIFSEYYMTKFAESDNDLIKKVMISDPSLLEKYSNANKIILSDDFNDKINILSNITHVTFGQNFNSEINGLPDSITNLTFGFYFNQKIKGALPPFLIYLKFGYSFNQYIIGEIPDTVIKLIFGNKFNNKIQGAIPKNVTYLVFGEDFNRSIENSIPESVIYLKFGYEFDSFYDNLLPKNLKYLKIKYLEYGIPKTVTHLEIIKQHLVPIPDTITHLYCGEFIHYKELLIPSSVTHLYLYSVESGQEVLDNVPKIITHLYLNNLFFGRFPRDLEYLKTEECLLHKSINIFPSKLKYIRFGKTHMNKKTTYDFSKFQFIREPNYSISNNITHLIFDDKFNKNICKLPDNITNLIFGKSFEKSLENCLSKNLQYLRIFNTAIINQELENFTDLQIVCNKENCSINLPKCILRLYISKYDL